MSQPNHPSQLVVESSTHLKFIARNLAWSNPDCGWKIHRESCEIIQSLGWGALYFHCSYTIERATTGLTLWFLLPKGKRHFIGINLHARSRAMSERSNPSHISSPLAFDTCLRPQARKNMRSVWSPLHKIPHTPMSIPSTETSITYIPSNGCVCQRWDWNLDEWNVV